MIKVKRKRQKALYRGPALGMRAKLGRISPGARKRRYRVIVQLPHDAAGSVQGGSTSFTLKWRVKPLRK